MKAFLLAGLVLAMCSSPAFVAHAARSLQATATLKPGTIACAWIVDFPPRCEASIGAVESVSPVGLTPAAKNEQDSVVCTGHLDKATCIEDEDHQCLWRQVPDQDTTCVINDGSANLQIACPGSAAEAWFKCRALKGSVACFLGPDCTSKPYLLDNTATAVDVQQESCFPTAATKAMKTPKDVSDWLYKRKAVRADVSGGAKPFTAFWGSCPAAKAKYAAESYEARCLKTPTATCVKAGCTLTEDETCIPTKSKQYDLALKGGGLIHDLYTQCSDPALIEAGEETCAAHILDD